MRRMLLFILVLGIVGTGAELLLVGHYEDPWQALPLALFALALLLVAWQQVSRGAASIRALQLVMTVFVVSGGLGVYLHYAVNAEFEREMYPELSGFALFKEAIRGATPALAPGTMVLLGLIGLVYTHEHPRLDRRGARMGD